MKEKAEKTGITLFDCLEKMSVLFHDSGRIRCSETYRLALNSFRRFRKGKDIELEDIDASLIGRYQSYLLLKGVTRNTVSFYMRILRAAYNRTVADAAAYRKNPFRYVYTGVDKTVKRALSLDSIRGIKDCNLEKKSLAFARDIFMLSFYMRGISLIDMAFLRKSDLNDSVLVYRRHKTGQLLQVKWEPCMQAIVEKYTEKDSVWLLPIIERHKGKDIRGKYLNAAYSLNRSLHIIGVMAGLPHPLTMYVARHSWASIANSSNIPVSVISEGLGHDCEKTTKIYLNTLDTSAVDNANRKIIGLLNF